MVTGIRRCGKSTLLMQFQQWLKENGVTQEQIVSVNFEELEYEDLLDYKKLHQYLKERLVSGKITYIFLDEIQKVPSFEKVVDSICKAQCRFIYYRFQCVYAFGRFSNTFDRQVCGDKNASAVSTGVSFYDWFRTGTGIP